MSRISGSSSAIVIAVFAALVVGAADTASAQSRKDSAATSSGTECYGTPIIMQGLDCPQRPARGEAPKQATKDGERPRVTARGSGGSYSAPLPITPPLTSPAPTGPYIPPPVANPSERIMQLNQSFPLDRGLGFNPTDRDAYIRYNLNNR